MFRSLLLLGFLLVPLSASQQLFFMPDQAKEGQAAVVRTIDGAKNEINIAMYSFTNAAFAKALKKAAARGVKVTIVFDKEGNVNRSYSRLGDLAKIRNIRAYTLSGLPAKSGKYDGKMHMKIAVVDKKTVIFGSANWSKSAFSLNHEFLVIETGYPLAKKFNKAFERVLQQAKPY